MDEPDRVNRFRRLYERHYAALLGYARRRLAARVDAEDVVADTFLVLWRRLDEAPDDEQLLPWLYGVIRRVMANRYRSQEREAHLLRRLTELRRTQTYATELEGSEAQGLFSALSALREDDRELLLLAAWEGLTTAELGSVFGCTANAAAIRLHRARQRLARAVAKETATTGHEQRKH